MVTPNLIFYENHTISFVVIVVVAVMIFLFCSPNIDK